MAAAKSLWQHPAAPYAVIGGVLAGTALLLLLPGSMKTYGPPRSKPTYLPVGVVEPGVVLVLPQTAFPVGRPGLLSTPPIALGMGTMGGNVHVRVQRLEAPDRAVGTVVGIESFNDTPPFQTTVSRVSGEHVVTFDPKQAIGRSTFVQAPAPVAFGDQTAAWYSWRAAQGGYEPLFPQPTARDALEVMRFGGFSDLLLVRSAGPLRGDDLPISRPGAAPGSYALWRYDPQGWVPLSMEASEESVMRSIIGAPPLLYYYVRALRA